MITHDARWSLTRGKNPVPSPWQATARTPAVRYGHCSYRRHQLRRAEQALCEPPDMQRQARNRAVANDEDKAFLDGMGTAPDAGSCMASITDPARR
jgi:hypothetical protein